MRKFVLGLVLLLALSGCKRDNRTVRLEQRVDRQNRFSVLAPTGWRALKTHGNLKLALRKHDKSVLVSVEVRQHTDRLMDFSDLSQLARWYLDGPVPYRIEQQAPLKNGRGLKLRYSSSDRRGRKLVGVSCIRAVADRSVIVTSIARKEGFSAHRSIIDQICQSLKLLDVKPVPIRERKVVSAKVKLQLPANFKATNRGSVALFSSPGAWVRINVELKPGNDLQAALKSFVEQAPQKTKLNLQKRSNVTINGQSATESLYRLTIDNRVAQMLVWSISRGADALILGCMAYHREFRVMSKLCHQIGKSVRW